MTKATKNKRRLIASWTTQPVARLSYACTFCDTKIHPTQVYIRRVYANRSQIDVEYEHASPDCADRCY